MPSTKAICLIALLGLGILVTPQAHAQSPFSSCLNGTGNIYNATLIVPVESTPDVNGVPLAAGSEIAVFSSDPAFPDLCVGMLTWQGSQSFMAVWGDDDMTPARDGLLTGEGLQYRVWDPASGIEYSSESVQVSYAQGDGLYADDAIFVLSDLSIMVAPSAPILSEPFDGATDVSVDPQLTWNAVSDADSYHLQLTLTTDSLFATPLVDDSTLTALSYDAVGLEHETPYQWRVQAANTGGASPWSTERSFTTEQAPILPPEAPTLASPSEEATDVEINPTLTWDASTAADSYRLQLALDANFSTVVLNQSGLADTTHQVTGLEHATPYFWRVKAANTSGDSPWSAVWSFTTEQAPILPPEAPTLASPSDEATNVGINPTLTWNASAGAVSYHVQLANDASFSTFVLNQDDLADTTHQATGLAHETPYFWRVMAANTSGDSPWSAVHSFMTELAPILPPEAPTLAEPLDGATNVSVDPTLTWNASAGADSYRLQLTLTADSLFATPLVDDATLTALAYDAAGLAHETPYRWRVMANNASGDSPWSAVRSFTTEQAPVTLPATPQLLSPAHGAVDVPVQNIFSWSTSANASAYHLQASTSQNFSTLIIDEPDRSDTTYQTSGLPYATQHYWRVRASNTAGNSSWSAVHSFTTEQAPVLPPEAPTLASPSDGATDVPINPTLTWNAASGADSYRLQLALDINFSIVVLNQSGLAGTTRQVTGLEHETSYFWRVKASNASGDSPWSAGRSFTTEQAPVILPATPQLLNPAHRASDVPIQSVLSWSASAGADSYHVQISISRNFSTLIIDEPGRSDTTYQALGLQYTTKYYWRVRAGNTAGNSSWSAVRNYRTEPEPVPPVSQPTLISLPDGATDAPVNPHLIWNAAWGAGSYRLQLARDAGFSTVVLNQSGLADTTHQVTGLENETPYFWRVMASNAGGSSPWSAVRSFTTEQAPILPPETPTLVSPSEGATGVEIYPTFIWNASNGADSYRLQVSTRSNFAKRRRVIDEPNLTHTSFDATGLQYSETYYWRVKASNASGHSPWSTVRRFTIEHGAPGRVTTPPLVEPVNAAINVPTSVLMVWAPAGGVSVYRLQMSEQDDFSRIVVDEDNLGGTSYEVDDLDYETTYYWRIRAGNHLGSSEWSRMQHFTTGNASGLLAPRPAVPAYAATNVAIPTTLVWNITPFATAYRILIMRAAPSGGGDEVVIDSTDIAGSSIQLHALEANTEYTWRIKAISTAGDSPWSSMYRFTTDGDTTPTARASEETIPDAVRLYQNYPNPFNPETTIAFDVPAALYVTLKIYDLMGKTRATLVSETLPAGRHQVRWEASGLPSGLYLYQLQTGNHTLSRTLTVLK